MALDFSWINSTIDMLCLINGYSAGVNNLVVHNSTLYKIAARLIGLSTSIIYSEHL